MKKFQKNKKKSLSLTRVIANEKKIVQLNNIWTMSFNPFYEST